MANAKSDEAAFKIKCVKTTCDYVAILMLILQTLLINKGYGIFLKFHSNNFMQGVSKERELTQGKYHREKRKTIGNSVFSQN